MFNRMYKLVKVSLSMWGVVSLYLSLTHLFRVKPWTLDHEIWTTVFMASVDSVHGTGDGLDMRQVAHTQTDTQNSWHAAFHKVVHSHTSERWATVAIFLNIHFSIYIPKLKQNTRWRNYCKLAMVYLFIIIFNTQRIDALTNQTVIVVWLLTHKTWNSLPAALRDSLSLLCFRRRLKSSLFQSSFDC